MFDVKNRYPKILNIVLYQVLWFGCVFFQNKFLIPALFLIALHFLLCQQRLKELTVVLGCSAIGILVDSLLTSAGFYEFSQPPLWPLVPMWLAILWVGFAGTLRHGLSYFMERPYLALAAAALGAPLTYHAASRFGAVQFPVGAIGTAAAVSASWIAMMVLFLWLNRRVACIAAAEEA